MASGPAPVPYGVVISHWFNRHRGLALGLSMMGIGIGSIVVPMLAQRLITTFGWRMAFAIFGAAVLLLPLPFIAALLQNDPEQRGLHPDGDEKIQASHLPPQDKQGLTWHEIWHSPTFWIMICIFCLAGASVHGALLHLSAILTDRGVTAERAAIATSLVGAAVIVGRLGSGYLLDHFFAPRVAILFYGATALGMATLCAGNAGNSALVASFLIGLGIGAEIETMGYMISRYLASRPSAPPTVMPSAPTCSQDPPACSSWAGIRPLSFLYRPPRNILRRHLNYVGLAHPSRPIPLRSRTGNQSADQAHRNAQRSIIQSDPVPCRT